MNFFRSVILAFDPILNNLIMGTTDLYVVFDFYKISYDFNAFLSVWHKFIYLNFRFNFIFSKYASFYGVFVEDFNSIIESFIVIDFYYANKFQAFAGDMFKGFFTNYVFLCQYKLLYKKILFLNICQRYTHNFFYRNFVQYLYKSVVNINNINIRIPDFFLSFSSDNKLPTGAFEFLNLNIISLGVFDLQVSASCLRKFVYSFVCGDLSFFCFIFLLKLFFFDYICAYFERIKLLCKKCKVKQKFHELSDFNFNYLISTTFFPVDNVSKIKFVADDLLLLIRLQRKLCFNYMESVDIFCKDFYTYLYLYLILLIRF